MKWVQTILLFSLALFVAGDSSEEVINQEKDLEKLMYKVGWKEDKATFLEEFIKNTGGRIYNFTLVAWQDIHDEKGNIKEIRTLELVIPSIEEGTEDDSAVDFDYTSYDDLITQIKYIQDDLNNFIESDLSVTKTAELYSDVGGEYYQIVASKNKLYSSLGGYYSLYNETIENATPERIEGFVKAHQQAHTYDTAILRYDAQGKFIPENSVIVPPLIVTVADIEEAPVGVVDQVVDIVGRVAARYRDGDISQPIYDALNKEVSDYIWNVMEDPQGYYVTKDFGIYVQYDPIELDYRSEYYLYAVKK